MRDEGRQTLAYDRILAVGWPGELAPMQGNGGGAVRAQKHTAAQHLPTLCSFRQRKSSCKRRAMEMDACRASLSKMTKAALVEKLVMMGAPSGAACRL
jgi:hypothetical protein